MQSSDVFDLPNICTRGEVINSEVFTKTVGVCKPEIPTKDLRYLQRPRCLQTPGCSVSPGGRESRRGGAASLWLLTLGGHHSLVFQVNTFNYRWHLCLHLMTLTCSGPNTITCLNACVYGHVRIPARSLYAQETA